MTKAQIKIARGKRKPLPPVNLEIPENLQPKTSADYLDATGREKPSNVPIAPPIGYVKQPTLVERMRQMIATEMSLRAQADGQETFEEADDFEVGDDYDPTSPYEETFEPPPEAAAPPAASPSPPPRGGEGTIPPTGTPPAPTTPPKA